MKKLDRYDMVIVGGGAAGCAAAIAARRRGLRVRVLARETAPSARAWPVWLSPAGLSLCDELGVKAAAARFSGLRMWMGDLSKRIDIDDKELTGAVVLQDALAAALRASCQAHSAEWGPPADVAALELGESCVHARTAAGDRVDANVLIIADGAPSACAALARLPDAAACEQSGAVAWADFEADGSDPRFEVFIGPGRFLRTATLVRVDGRARLTLMTHEQQRPAAVQLRELIEAVRKEGLISAAGEVVVHAGPCLAGAALELDTHVGKRCLLVGDAGGFVCAFSNEGVYPALRSGVLAADVVAGAVRAEVLQDALQAFSVRWRAEMADYLRLPNTDLGLLMPMIFNNAQMARRVARAFMLGCAF